MIIMRNSCSSPKNKKLPPIPLYGYNSKPNLKNAVSSEHIYIHSSKNIYSGLLKKREIIDQAN